MVAFCMVFLIRHSGEEDSRYGSDDGDGDGFNPFRTPARTFIVLYNLIFGFELPLPFDNRLAAMDQFLIIIFKFVVVIVMLNVLIAIVSDS